MKHVPNVLTVGRMIAAPVCLYLLWTGTVTGQIAGAALFIIAAITDWLDGQIARKYGVGSRLGQFLDPLADKVLVLGAFFLIPFLQPIGQGLAAPVGSWLPWAAIGAIAVRDVAVTVLRAVYEKRGRTLATSTAAKWKTAWQLTFLITAFVFLAGRHLEALGGAFGALGSFLAAALASPVALVFLLATAAVTVWTGVLYFRQPAG
ncbi:CDP-alcohol phosphatidyltransferase family protein [Rubrivirga sp. IMCC43871]|uniref:CDP-alcohol phosphatidyltransferase family protein n=1 Tax=Rubrivirga sp. IMCC43871 TaxID=3391575 RepID=UPI00398FA761